MSAEIPRETGFLEHDGERLYWERLGAGDATPLVLCHGLGGNHAVWLHQVASFAATRPVVVWDHRGFGRSTDRAGRSAPEVAWTDLCALLDHLAYDRVDLVGQSMGGWTALAFALAEPERVDHLVLADTLGGLYDTAIEEAFTAARDALGAPALGVPPQLGQHPALGAGFIQRDPAHAWLYQALAAMVDPDVAQIAPRLLASRQPTGRVKNLRRPVLFVVGEQDWLFPPAVVHVAAAAFPDARVEEIEGCGHSPYFEAPAAWNAVVGDFLAAALPDG